MEEEAPKHPLLVAAAVAGAVLLLFVLAGRVDVHRCHIETSTEAKQSVTRVEHAPQLERTLRLWLDAGEIDEDVREALERELALGASPVRLTDEVTPGARVTLRVDDASFYTPLFASVAVTALMTFESGTHDRRGSSATGEARLTLSGSCYGIVSPTGFGAELSDAIAKPFAAALRDALR